MLKEVSTQTPGDPFRVKDIIKLYSLFNRFNIPDVRADFCAGQIIDHVDLIGLLEGLDTLRYHVLPEWCQSRPPVQWSLIAADMESLLESRDEVFVPLGQQIIRLTFDKWMKILDNIAKSTYWKRDIVRRSPVQRFLSVATGGPNPAGVVNDQNGDSAGMDLRIKNEINEPLNNVRNIEIDADILSDSQTENETDTSDSELEDVSPSGQQLPAGSIIFPKEVVQPQVFEMDGVMSFTSFLTTFERYFKTKYTGGSRDRTQELARFLPPEMLMAYQALGGRQLKYDFMKTELKKWYNARAIKGKRYWKKVLSDTQMKEGETLALYGMRLKQIALKAYPTSTIDCLRELRHHYVKTVPSWFRLKMETLEDLQEQLGGKKRLSWEERMKLAEKEDRRQGNHMDLIKPDSSLINDRSIYFSNPNSKENAKGGQPTSKENNKNQGKRNNNRKKPNGKPQTSNNSQAQGAIPKNNSQKNGSPAEVGGSQQSSSVSFPIQNLQNENPRPNNKIRKYCNWCGASNHVEQDCWRKNGACLICGSTSHLLTECPSFKSRVPQPTCSGCGGPHLGKDCTNRVRSNPGSSSLNC